MWDKQASLFQNNFRVISYDQRGHGKTPSSPSPYFFESLIDDLVVLMDHLHVGKAVLCGLSMGGYVALRAAERVPERLLGLVLCDTKSEADANLAKQGRAANVKLIQEQGLHAFTEKFLKSVLAPETLASKTEVVQKVKGMMESCPAKGVQEALLAMATRTDTTESLSKIHVPTLIIVGEKDIVTPPAAAQALQKGISGSALSILPQAAHLSNLENDGAFNAVFTKFMQSFTK